MTASDYEKMRIKGANADYVLTKPWKRGRQQMGSRQKQLGEINFALTITPELDFVVEKRYPFYGVLLVWHWLDFKGKNQLGVYFWKKQFWIIFSLTLRKLVKKCQNLIFNVNFQCQSSMSIFNVKNHQNHQNHPNLHDFFSFKMSI